uniref:F-box domain-containing protein n=1 Tax=Panagrolaimus superbus TaxID=310955 RepID=A0A914YYR3_9BILA
MSTTALDESDREELCRLRHEVLQLQSSNDTLISSIHHLSGELLKRRNPFPLTPSSSSMIPMKRSKQIDPLNIFRFSQKSALGSQKKEASEKEDIGLPNEIMLHLFKYLSRSDLDRSALVCRRWKKIIDVHRCSLARRRIRLFKIIETTPNVIMFSAATSTQNIKYHFDLNLNGENQSPDVIHRVAKMLKYSKVRRLVMCGFRLTEVMVHDLVTIFKKADILFHRLEMIGVSLRNLSADTFQKFIGEHIIADQYFLDGICDSDSDHFGSRLFERTGIKKAEDVTIYDVSSINDEEVILDVGDDVLLDFIFGKYTDAVDRATVYLDNPAISSAFVYNALVRFAQESDLKHAIIHSEISHCRDQIVHNNRSTRFEYNVEVQAEYSSANKYTNSVLEAKVSKTADDEFVHVTLTIAAL